MWCSTKHAGGNRVCWVNTYKNSWSRGAIVGGIGLMRLSGLTWRTKHKETPLFKLTLIMGTLPIEGWIDVLVEDVST